MVKNKTQRLALLTMGACLILTACAGGSKRPPERENRGGPGGREMANAGSFAQPVALFFAGMERDGDMFVSTQEMLDGVDAAWIAAAQPDGIRALDYSDWALLALGSSDAPPAYVAFDTNFDGRITADEFRERFQQEFRLMDSNRDGVLARIEMVARIQRQNTGPDNSRSSSEGGQRRPPPGGR